MQPEEERDPGAIKDLASFANKNFRERAGIASVTIQYGNRSGSIK